MLTATCFSVRALVASASLVLCLYQTASAAPFDLNRNLDTCQAGDTLADYGILLSSQSGSLTRDLVKAGLSQSDAQRAMTTLMRAAKVKAGTQPLHVTVATSADACGHTKPQIVALTLGADGATPVTVVRHAGGAFEPISAPEKTDHPVRVTGHVTGADLGTALQDGGLPATLAAELVDSFTTDGELPLETQKDIHFDVLYQVTKAPGGIPVEANLTVAALIADGHEHRVYFYRTRTGEKLPIDREGNLVGGPQEFIHPLPEGKLTSPFGWRRHPVLHVRKFHNGIDFSAPRGTPVVAAADGKVMMADKHKNYGRLIRLAHDEHITTTYAHLDGFAPTVKAGATVRQGQVIGYVGHSGLASGNHLYFEMLVDGHCVDPMDMAPELAATEVDAPRDEIQRFVQLADALRASVPGDDPAH